MLGTLTNDLMYFMF